MKDWYQYSDGIWVRLSDYKVKKIIWDILANSVKEEEARRRQA